MKYTILSLVAGALISCSAMAENTLTVKMNDALSSGTGENIGEITVSETPYGLLFTPHLNGLTPGNSRLPCPHKPKLYAGNERR